MSRKNYIGSVRWVELDVSKGFFVKSDKSPSEKKEFDPDFFKTYFLMNKNKYFDVSSYQEETKEEALKLTGIFNDSATSWKERVLALQALQTMKIPSLKPASFVDRYENDRKMKLGFMAFPDHQKEFEKKYCELKDRSGLIGVSEVESALLENGVVAATFADFMNVRCFQPSALIGRIMGVLDGCWRYEIEGALDDKLQATFTLCEIKNVSECHAASIFYSSQRREDRALEFLVKEKSEK